MRRLAAIAALSCLALLSSCARQLAYPPENVLLNESRIEMVQAVPVDSGASQTLRGTIQDGNGEPVIGAVIVAGCESSKWSGTVLRRGFTHDRWEKLAKDGWQGAASDVRGEFSLALPKGPGPWVLRAESSGYRPATLKGLSLTSPQSVQFKVTLAADPETPFHRSDYGSQLDFRSTTTGAVISNWNEQTGEPSVHPH